MTTSSKGFDPSRRLLDSYDISNLDVHKSPTYYTYVHSATIRGAAQLSLRCKAVKVIRNPSENQKRNLSMVNISFHLYQRFLLCDRIFGCRVLRILNLRGFFDCDGEPNMALKLNPPPTVLSLDAVNSLSRLGFCFSWLEDLG